MTAGSVGLLQAQGALDPSVAPRAAQLERQGDRRMATELLGRYLATAQDDGQAWFHLGRFYLLDARDWHFAGHKGEPTARDYLDFAGIALDQAGRLLVDSGIVYRAMVEMDRARLDVEEAGWDSARARRMRSHDAPVPPFILELGENLLHSCPANGVLLTGSDLETLAVWYASLEAGQRRDVLPIEPRLYTVDSLYRGQMARAMGVDAGLPVRQALSGVAGHRPICLTPYADTAAVPFNVFAPMRLVRVNLATAATATDEPLSVATLLTARREGGNAWSVHVLAVYAAAARYNTLLCSGILRPLRDRPIDPSGPTPLGACGH